MLIALPNSLAVRRVLAVLDGAFPGFRLWSDGVGVVWRGERGGFHPHQLPGTEVWPFLEAESTRGYETPDGDDEPVIERPAEQVADTDPLVRQIRLVIRDLVTARKSEATIDELRNHLPVDARPGATDQRVGKVLAMPGLQGRRVKEKGVRFRVYDLTGTRVREGPDEVQDGDPRMGPDLNRGPAGSKGVFDRRVPDFSSENPKRDPTARRDPRG